MPPKTEGVFHFGAVGGHGPYLRAPRCIDPLTLCAATTNGIAKLFVDEVHTDKLQ